MEQEVLRELVAKNRELETQLTKRNEQYVFDLNKSLSAANLSEEAKVLAFSEILPELVDGQKTGKTARQLFGTVSERTLAIIDKPEPVRESTMWEMWLDNALLIFGFLAITTGLLGLFSKKSAGATYGIITLFVAAISGGYAFYLMYKYIYQYERPGADKSKKPGVLKTGVIIFFAFMAWFIIFTASSLITPTINLQFVPVVNVALGAIAIGIRYLLKKKYKIQGSILMR